MKWKSCGRGLVIPVGKLAIAQFMTIGKLDSIIGRSFSMKCDGHAYDLIPLPHPSGASPWHRISAGERLVRQSDALDRATSSDAPISVPLFHWTLDVERWTLNVSSSAQHVRSLSHPR